jgi:hypothetical protein
MNKIKLFYLFKNGAEFWYYWNALENVVAWN